jgi:hypothetical protein
VELYDPLTDMFALTTPMATARRAYAPTVLLTGEVLIAGGAVSSAQLDTAELYDLYTETWNPTANNLSAIKEEHTALRNGLVLVAGGGAGDGVYTTASADLYDPVTPMFSPTASLGSARKAHTATLLQNGTVLVTGGGSGDQFLGE